ncbi:hydrolase, TatD family, partial [Cooperia oncophora]
LFQCTSLKENAHSRSDGDPEVQKEVFSTQLDLAKHFDLPIVIHCRSGPRGTFDAEESCLEVLEKTGISGFHNIHRHCFTENWDVACRWLRKYPNMCFGFTSIISSWEQNEKEKYEVLKRLPLRKILLETDAPYFRPNQYDCVKGGKNLCHYDKISFPPMAVNVAFVIAKAKNLDVNEVIRETTMNAKLFYRIMNYDEL